MDFSFLLAQTSKGRTWSDTIVKQTTTTTLPPPTLSFSKVETQNSKSLNFKGKEYLMFYIHCLMFNIQCPKSKVQSPNSNVQSIWPFHYYPQNPSTRAWHWNSSCILYLVQPQVKSRKEIIRSLSKKMGSTQEDIWVNIFWLLVLWI